MLAGIGHLALQIKRGAALTSRELPAGWNVVLVDGAGKAIAASGRSRLAADEE